MFLSDTFFMSAGYFSQTLFLSAGYFSQTLYLDVEERDNDAFRKPPVIKKCRLRNAGRHLSVGEVQSLTIRSKSADSEGR